MARNRSISFAATLTNCLLVILALSNCKSGLDPTALESEGRLIDYTKEITKLDPSPAAAIVYGKLTPDASSRYTTDAMTVTYAAVVDALSQLTSGLPEAAKATVETWSTKAKEEMEAGVGPFVSNAEKDSAEAVKLAQSLQPYLQLAGSKSLASNKTPLEQSLPDAAQPKFSDNYRKLDKSVERLYQMAVFSAQHTKQLEAKKYLSQISSALDTLYRGTDEKAPVFGNSTDRAKAREFMIEAKEKFGTLKIDVDSMSSFAKTSERLKEASAKFKSWSNELGAKYTNLTQMAARPPIVEAVSSLVSGIDELIKVAAAYEPIEKAFMGTQLDGDLIAIAAKAFASDASSVIGASVDEETDINRLTKALASNKTIIIPADDSSQSIVYALASAVKNKVSKDDLPNSSAVLGINHALLINDKKELGMSDKDFNKYLKSLGQKIVKAEKDNGEVPIYVVFADKYPASAKLAPMLTELSKGKGKVVVIAKDTDNFNGVLFVPHGLNVSEAAVIADKILEQEGVVADREPISTRFARLFAASASMNLGNIGSVVKKLSARVKADPGQYDDKILSVLASIPAQVPRSNAAHRVLTDPLKLVQDNLRRDPQYYRTGGEFVSVDNDLSQEVEKSRQQRVADEVRKEAGSEWTSMNKALSIGISHVHDKIKRVEAEAAQARLIKALADKKADIQKEIKFIKSTYNDCFQEITDTKQQLEVLGNKFSDRFGDTQKVPAADRQKFLDLQITDELAKRIFRGVVVLNKENPNDSDPDKLISRMSCIAPGGARPPATNYDRKGEIIKILDNLNTTLAEKINQIETEIPKCLNEEGFSNGLESCLKKTMKKYVQFRRDLVSLPGKSPLEELTEKLLKLPPYNLEKIKPQYGKNPFSFWSKSSGTWTRQALVAAKDGDTVGRYFYVLSNDQKTGLSADAIKGREDQLEAFRDINSHFYIKEIFDIIGTANLDEIIVNNQIKKYNPVTKKSSDASAERTMLLGYIFEDFEDVDSILGKLEKNIRDEYKFFVASYITKNMWKVQQAFHDEVASPFWKMNSNVMLGLYKKPVYNAASAFTVAIQELNFAMRKDFLDNQEDFNEFRSAFSNAELAAGTFINALTDAGFTDLANKGKKYFVKDGVAYRFKNEALLQALKSGAELVSKGKHPLDPPPAK